jgi:hypothetical protein
MAKQNFNEDKRKVFIQNEGNFYPNRNENCSTVNSHSTENDTIKETRKVKDIKVKECLTCKDGTEYPNNLGECPKCGNFLKAKKSSTVDDSKTVNGLFTEEDIFKEIRIAIDKNDPRELKKLLTKVSDINVRFDQPYEELDIIHFCPTPLTYAEQRHWFLGLGSDVEILNLLLDKGANVNFVPDDYDISPDRPGERSTFNNDYFSLELLLDNGLNNDTGDPSDFTLLELAKMGNRSLEIIELIKRYI